MRVFIAGGSGFIGRWLAAALVARGHHVVSAARHAVRVEGVHSISADFRLDLESKDWVPRVQGYDVVVNAVGILRERGTETFSAVHQHAVHALFDGCVKAGVRKIIQISALGADEHAQSAYHLSKRHADEYLGTLPTDWVIVQPSLVFGADGASAKLFTTLAALPLIPLPGHGKQLVQPIHIEDLCSALVKIVEGDGCVRCRMAAVGPRAVTFRDMLASLRAQLGLPPAHFLVVPTPIVNGVARLSEWLPSALFDRETLAMLERGNMARPGPIAQLLERSPRPLEQFIAPHEAASIAVAAKMNWLRPLLRISVALVWIVSGVVSLGLFPVEQSYALLAQVGLSGSPATIALYGAAGLDLLFGIGALSLRRRRWLWCAQMAVILAYSAIIAWRLPQFWVHPFGPLLKNIPMLAAIAVLYETEQH